MNFWKRTIICIAFLIMVSGHTVVAQEMRDYTLYVSKINQDACNVHISCSFMLDFEDSDSVSMNFGGADFSIENLKISDDDFVYEYNRKAKKFVIRKRNEQTVRVGLDYGYTNLSAFFIYGEGDAELWETSFGEYFYPYIPNTYMDVTINVETPDSIFSLCSYPLKSNSDTKYSGKLQSILSQSLSLAFMRNDAYRHSVAYIPDKVDIYQISGMQCNNERYEELLELTEFSITFFSKVYGEDYISEVRNVTAFPTYLFHNGQGFSNRYNIGFISASQEKFSTYLGITFYPIL